MEKQAIWATDEQVINTIAAIKGNAFTVLEFRRVFATLYPGTFTDLEVAFGTKGDGSRRAYTATSYLGNRLWQISKKPGSPLLPLERWQKGGVETPSQRRATPEERAMGAETMVRVFRKRV